MANFIFLKNDSYNSPIKATKRNIELLKLYARENTTDYMRCECDCTGSTKRTYKVKVKKGKCWLIEYGSVDC